MCSDLLSVSMLVSQWDMVGSHDLIYIPELRGSKSSVSVSYPGFIARIRALIGGQFLTFVPAVALRAGFVEKLILGLRITARAFA